MKRFLKLFVPLFFLSCVNASSQKTDTTPSVLPVKKQKNTNRFTPDKPIKVSWIEVKTGDKFWDVLKTNNKNVALIGTEICPPCELAKAWWEEQIAPPGWQFVYWQLNSTNDYLTRSFKRIFLELERKDNLTLPYLSIIEDIGDPRRNKKITETFSSYTDCTVGANKFLLMHPQGIIHF